MSNFYQCSKSKLKAVYKNDRLEIMMYKFVWDFICNCTNVTNLHFHHFTHFVSFNIMEMSEYQLW